MAFTQEMLDELETAYAQGILGISHGDKRIQYASLAEMWQAILRIRAALAPKSKKFISGRAGYVRF